MSKTWVGLEKVWSALGNTWAGIFVNRKPTGIELLISGSGDLGPNTPGWRVQEYVPPVEIGGRAGGTGSVTVDARAEANSLLLINNDAVTTHADSLGEIRGVVKTVSDSGLVASITHSTVLDLLDAERFIPPLGAGSVWSALDMGTQLVGSSRLNVEAFQ